MLSSGCSAGVLTGEIGGDGVRFLDSDGPMRIGPSIGDIVEVAVQFVGVNFGSPPLSVFGETRSVISYPYPGPL